MADSVATNFQAEIRNAYRELQSFEKPPFFDVNAESYESPYPRCEPADVSERPYPYFESVFWMDEKGRQKIRWRTDSIRLPLSDRGVRPYFRNVVEKNLWHVCVPPQSDCRGRLEKMQPFTLEPVMSWTTGEYLAVLAAPSEHEMADHTRLVAAAMTLRLPAAIRPVVRPGFGFAIVDDDGEVKFLSDWASNPDTNVFTECAKGEQLRALVRYHHTDYLTTDFHSRPHRLYVRPLGDENLILPWSLIAFEDRTEVARELRRKRLIETSPIRVINETFRRFVSHELTPEQIYAWEREGEGRAWGKTGIVVAGVVAMAILVVVVGQDNDLVKLVTVVITFATSLLGISGKLFAKAQSRGDDGSTQE